MTKIDQINDQHQILIENWRPFFFCLKTLNFEDEFPIKSKKFTRTQKIPRCDPKNDRNRILDLDWRPFFREKSNYKKRDF